MNTKIETLLAELNDNCRNADAIKAKLQKEYDKVFDDSKALAKAIANAENASMYQIGEDGEVESWFRFSGLSDFHECREYFETWLLESHCMMVDWDNDCFLYSQGESLIIQDDARNRRDNGVWLSGKQIIEESEYRDDDGEVDESKRNELIEAWMEKNGYFPGVFRVDNYGNVSHVNTQKKDGGAA